MVSPSAHGSGAPRLSRRTWHGLARLARGGKGGGRAARRARGSGGTRPYPSGRGGLGGGPDLELCSRARLGAGPGAGRRCRRWRPLGGAGSLRDCRWRRGLDMGVFKIQGGVCSHTHTRTRLHLEKRERYIMKNERNAFRPMFTGVSRSKWGVEKKLKNFQKGY